MIEQDSRRSTRGGSSAVQVDPADPASAGEDSRRDRVIKRGLVRGLVPPEQDGNLTLPASMRSNPEAVAAVKELTKRYPDLKAYWADAVGELSTV